MRMAKQKRLNSGKEFEFHTGEFFGKYQIPIVIFLTLVALSAFYGVFFWSRKEEPLVIKAFVIIFLTLYVYKILIGTAISWFINMYNLAIYGNKIIGENLFGKKKIIYINNIKCVRKKGGWNSLEIIDEHGHKMEIVPDIDFYGFIYDYILLRIHYNSYVDLKTINKYRNNYKMWSYTKRYPFKTKYPKGYMQWFRPLAEKQKQEMIAKGILKEGVLYGQDEDGF